MGNHKGSSTVKPMGISFYSKTDQKYNIMMAKAYGMTPEEWKAALWRDTWQTLDYWEVIALIGQLRDEFNDGTLKRAEDKVPRVKHLLSTKKLDFIADDFFDIRGRGLVATVTLPRRYYSWELYTGCTVFINEEEFRTAGIETMGTDPFRQGAHVSFLLREPKKDG